MLRNCKATSLKICLVLLGFLTIHRASGVEKPKDWLKTKPLYVGLNYSLQLNDIDFSPLIFIKPTKKWDVGAGINMLYYVRYSDRKRHLSLGTNLFARYYITKNIYAHGEYLWANIPVRNDLDLSLSRAWKTDLMLGAGYTQPFGNKWNGYLTGLIVLNGKPYSTFESRVLFRAGVSYKIR